MESKKANMIKVLRGAGYSLNEISNTIVNNGVVRTDRDKWLYTFFGQAMQGMLANGDHFDEDGDYYPSALEVIPRMSIKYAKALLKELEALGYEMTT